VDLCVFRSQHIAPSALESITTDEHKFSVAMYLIRLLL